MRTPRDTTKPWIQRYFFRNRMWWIIYFEWGADTQMTFRKACESAVKWADVKA